MRQNAALRLVDTSAGTDVKRSDSASQPISSITLRHAIRVITEQREIIAEIPNVPAVAAQANRAHRRLDQHRERLVQYGRKLQALDRDMRELRANQAETGESVGMLEDQLATLDRRIEQLGCRERVRSQREADAAAYYAQQQSRSKRNTRLLAALCGVLAIGLAITVGCLAALA